MEQTEIILVQAVTLDLIFAAMFCNNLTECLLDEAAQCIVLLTNTHRRIRGFQGRNAESPCRVLKREGAKALLDNIDQNAPLGKCNYLPLLLTELRMRELYILLHKQGCMGKRNGTLSIIDVPLNATASSILCMHLEMFTKKNIYLFVSEKNAGGPTKRAASSITLAFEGGADLALLQDAASHKDPRTTRQHQKRRNNLHKNAVDFIWL